MKWIGKISTGTFTAGFYRGSERVCRKPAGLAEANGVCNEET